MVFVLVHTCYWGFKHFCSMQLLPALLCIIITWFSAVQFRLLLRAMWCWISLFLSSNMATRLERQANHNSLLWSMNTVMWVYNITFYGQIRVIIQQCHYNLCLDLASITSRKLYLYDTANHHGCDCFVLFCSLALSSRKLKKALLKLWRSSLLESKGLNEKKPIGLENCV